MKYAMVTLFVAAMLFAMTSAPAFAGEEQAPLKIELPEKSFMGTPLDYWSEILESPTRRANLSWPRGRRTRVQRGQAGHQQR